MDKHEQEDVSRWVDERMRVLDPAEDWRPNAAHALARLRERRDGSPGLSSWKRLRWLFAAAATAAACLFALALFAPRVCASPRECAVSIWRQVFTKPTLVEQPAPPASPAAPARQREPAPARIATGPATPAQTSPRPAEPAVICEIFSDYECPACARFQREMVPMLVSEYVRTGKIKLVHRDFPLEQLHPYARLAARYANAARQAGYEEISVNQIFATQETWGKDGDVEGQLASILPRPAMDKVRDLVKNDPGLAASIAADMEQGRAMGISGTPTLVVVTSSGRRPLTGSVLFNFEWLRGYLDGAIRFTQ